jgi:hypothetical protein
VSGRAPDRKFAITWQGHEPGGGNALVLIRVVSAEGSQNINVVYGLNGDASATVGVHLPGWIFADIPFAGILSSAAYVFGLELVLGSARKGCRCAPARARRRTHRPALCADLRHGMLTHGPRESIVTRHGILRGT